MGVGGRGEGVGWIFGGKEEFRLGLVGLVMIGLGGGLDWDGEVCGGWCWLVMAGWVW